ncbi:sulfatase [Flammeovirga sp. MY04]|uniref:sulfatase n=1 Tax=Flammeovirga sp. MY04 TaxID=1191459 RepID=UPI0008061AE3|nr:sulfatase [Flammeovirga sp. MY04]ANQ52489.1 sulfatase [Flammeovirga sp. MY04]
MKKLLKSIVAGMLFVPATVFAQDKPNILFITVDDLRPELGAYGNETIKTPNIDQLSEHATTFNNAFCQVPVCGASRASMHTGVRPTFTRFVDAGAKIDKDMPNAVTMGQHFKENGYYTFSAGKVIHGKTDASKRSWSEYHPAENMFEYHNPELVADNENPTAPYKKSLPYEMVENCKDTDFLDGRTIELAKDRLKKFKKMDQPFFMAVGLARPHLPFVAPKRFWDKYKEDEIEMAKNPFLPEGIPAVAKTSYGELRAYRTVPRKGDIDAEMAKKLKHGYYASVSFSDYLLGELIDELKKQGLYDNTIIVLWGDHGWQLGEHTFWAKHTAFDIAIRVPFIIKPHSGKNAQSGATEGFAEMVDVFPTLCDLAGLEQPEQLQGQSLVPTLMNGDVSVKEYTLSRWKQGDTVRTKGFRYTLFRNKAGKELAEMMYDLTKDPQENKNIVNDPDYADQVKKHRALLKTALAHYQLDHAR